MGYPRNIRSEVYPYDYMLTILMFYEPGSFRKFCKWPRNFVQGHVGAAKYFYSFILPH